MKCLLIFSLYMFMISLYTVPPRKSFRQNQYTHYGHYPRAPEDDFIDCVKEVNQCMFPSNTYKAPQNQYNQGCCCTLL